MNSNNEQILRSIRQLEVQEAADGSAVALKNIPLVSVVMTTYNVELYVREAIDSILKQTHQRLELIIVDDSSSDNTVEIIRKINDPRIHFYRNKINCGTYYSKNVGITYSKGKYVAIQDSDDISHEFRLEKQVQQLEANATLKYSVCQYTRFDQEGNHLIPPRLAFQSALIRKDVFDEIGYYDSVRVAADDEFDARMRLYYGPLCRGVVEELLYFNRQRDDSLTSQIKLDSHIRRSYVEEYKRWHQSVTPDKSLCYTPFPLKSRPFPVDPLIRVSYNENIEPSVNTGNVTTDGQRVTASMATIASRLATLPLVIDSVLPQVDQLNIFLNNVSEVPAYLNHEKISVASSGEHGDLADNGKFFWTTDLTGFHFTIDDDIIYPPDYVATLKQRLAEFNYEPAIGTHGITINDPFISYYEPTSRTVLGFGDTLSADRYVHIIGTGTLAYHTSRVQFDLSNVSQTRMVDIYFGLNAQQKRIPLICVEHSQTWLTAIDTPTDTRIYHQFQNNDTAQTTLARSVEWHLNYLTFDLKESFTIGLDSDAEIKEVVLDRVKKWLKNIDEYRKTIQSMERRIHELEQTLVEKEKEIDWYRAHIEDFRTHSIEYRIKNSRFMPRWLMRPGKAVKNVLMSMLSKKDESGL